MKLRPLLAVSATGSLAVVGHDGGDKGRPDLAPLGGEVGLAEDDRRKVSLDETQRFV